jgi:hypothetical protein
MGADMTRRWKRRSILPLAALIIFCSVPLPNVLLPRFVVSHLAKPNQAAIEQYCRGQARGMQFAVSWADADVASLEARVWDRLRQRCGDWQSHVDYCRDQARTVQVAISASANPIQLKANMWGSYPSQLCGDWRSYLGG